MWSEKAIKIFGILKVVSEFAKAAAQAKKQDHGFKFYC